MLGPSGTRLVGEDAQDHVVVVASKEQLIWACAVASAVRHQKKKAYLYMEDCLPEEVRHFFDHVIEENDIESVLTKQCMDVYYCTSAKMLKHYRNIRHSGQSFAIVEGEMMCYLKGICGQCIQMAG